MTAPIKFDRRPYTVTYWERGERKTVRRVPPPKMHEGLPLDKVELNVKKNDDWDAGNTYKIASINPRNPNVLQLEDDDGNRTFVSYLDTTLTERDEANEPDGDKPIYDRKVSNRYLLWP